MAAVSFDDLIPSKAPGFDDLVPAEKPAPKSPGFFDDVGAVISGSVDKLKRDATTYYRDQTSRIGKPLPNPVRGMIQSARDTASLGGLIGDAVGVVASPVAGVVHAGLIKPGADLLDKIPMDAYSTPDIARPSTWMQTPRLLSKAEKHAANEQAVSTALMGVGGRVPGIIASAPRTRGLIETATRFNAAGVDPMIAAAGDKGAATVTNVIAENPIAGAAVRGRLRRAVQQTADSAGSLAARYGETRGPQITGENVQAGVQRFARDRRDPGSFAARAGANYDRVFSDLDAAMAGKTDPGASQIATPATTKALQDINASTQSAAVGQLVADPTLGRVAGALSDASTAKDMSFADLRRLRTWVRDAQKDPELRQKIGPANLQRLEGSLTQDIYANAGSLGSPQLAQQLRRADQFYAAGQARIGNALQSFADAQSGESAYSRVVQAAGSTARGDAQKLLSLKRSLSPDEWGDVTANIVSELGKQAPGAAEAGGGFSVNQFVTRYNQLSPRGRDILFGSVGGGGRRASALRAELDNLASVADDLKTIEKGANTSKTFVNAQAVGSLAGLVTPHAALPTAAGLGGMALTGEVLTNPVAVRWLVRLGRARKTGAAAAVGTVLKQLRSAAALNPALAPIYQESLKLLPAPQPVFSAVAAEPQDQTQGP